LIAGYSIACADPQQEVRAAIDFVDLVVASKADCMIPQKTIVRCGGPIKITGVNNVSVRGNGTRVEFLDARPGKGGIAFIGAQDLLIENLEIGWLGGGARDPVFNVDQRIQSFGQVAACPGQERGGLLVLDLPIDGIFPLHTVSIWDDHWGWPWYPSAPEGPEVYFAAGTVTRFASGRSPCLSQLAGWSGRRVLVRHVGYANAALTCSGCRHVSVENVRVTSAPGMAFVFDNGGSGITLRSNVVEPKCAPGCTLPEPSVAADAAHFADVEGGILIEGNDFGWQGDDSINITGLLAPAHVEPGDSHVLAIDKRWWWHLASLTVGSKVLLFDRGLSSLGEAEVLTIDSSGNRLKLSWLPENVADLIIVRAEGVPRNVIIRNNHFHDHRARGILIGGSKALISNNTIERVSMEAILVPADTGQWYEGPGAAHVIIERNTISKVNRFPSLPEYPSAISVGVSFSGEYGGSTGTPIRDIRIKDNRVDNVYRNGDMIVFVGRGVLDAHVRERAR
jgi:hypothetical protein